MKTPPLLISAALALWGWQSQWLLPAAVMAAVLEIAGFTKIRWEFSEADIGRIADLCTILLAGVVLVALVRDAERFMLRTLHWLPMIAFPLMAVQRYSRMGKVYGHVLLIFRRRQLQPKNRFVFDISYAYFFLCLISAAGVTTGRRWFYYSLCVLVGWALWPLRARRYPAVVWILLLLAGVSVGFAGQTGLHRLHRLILEKTYEYFARQPDPFKAATAIGDMIVLKQSSRILLRLAPEGPVALPILLSEAAYTAYERGTWYATQAGFGPIRPEAGAPGSWMLAEPATGAHRLYIETQLAKGRHLLHLPAGAFRIGGLEATSLEKNSLGAVRSSHEGGLARLRVDYAAAPSLHRPPDDHDLRIPEDEASAVRIIAERLALDTKSARESIAAVSSFFGRHFRYTLNAAAAASAKPDLADFLLHTRAGHCEYFATATVLLLRAAGIPARYMAGYAASEYSSLEDRIVVRRRHAHAWALAYRGGAWVPVDTTPADWLALESAGASSWVRVSDFFAFLRFRFALWCQRLPMQDLTLYLLPALAGLALLFIRRLSGKKHMRRVNVKAEPAAPALGSGRPSAFFAIETWLNRQGHVRQPGETFQNWFRRLSVEAPQIPLERLRPLLAQHYRCRFGPRALSPEDQETFAAGVRAAIVNYGPAEAPERGAADR